MSSASSSTNSQINFLNFSFVSLTTTSVPQMTSAGAATAASLVGPVGWSVVSEGWKEKKNMHLAFWNYALCLDAKRRLHALIFLLKPFPMTATINSWKKHTVMGRSHGLHSSITVATPLFIGTKIVAIDFSSALRQLRFLLKRTLYLFH